jgi:antitoxin (DNA-binding transcriptional repressor) of toxin-antitoxin stability system
LPEQVKNVRAKRTINTVQTVQKNHQGITMSITSLGLEQYRIKLPTMAALAQAGSPSIITRHGKPYAALVSVQALEKATTAQRKTSLLALAGTGSGLWGNSASQTIAGLRNEWDKV